MGTELSKNEDKWRLTNKNLKFLQLLVKGHKGPEAHRLSGYSGNTQAAYALKNKLKAQLGKLFESEGISKDRYLSDLVSLLNLPCVDKNNQPITSLKFDQYMEVRKALRDELPSNKIATPNITSFVIHRYDGNKSDYLPSNKIAKGDVIDISPVSGRGSKKD